MKVTIDGMTFEGSEEEIERVVHKYRPVVVTGGNPSAQPHGSDWLSRVNPGDPR